MPNPPEPSKRLFRLLLLLSIATIVGASVLYYTWTAHPNLEYWLELGRDGQTYLSEHPLLLILALATLPGMGAPLTPLLLLFGIVMGPRFGMPITCLIGVATLSFCTTWTYLLAAGPLRGFFKNHLLKKWNLPELSDQSALRLGLIIRITPGIPYPLQNVALGVMGMRLKPYLLVSLPIQSLYTIALIVTGGALFEGKAGIALTGVLLLIVVVIVTRILSNRSKTQTSHVG
ncbi:MAG: putative membrane protein YdjX (TVP38/TMEM64 family) [Lentimonas sp.]|jgi:uncharacterized membrane protein YdjX (TVP38/TMEM64 family)